MEALPTLPFPHTFLEYSDEFAPLSENLHQDLTSNLKANHDGKKLQGGEEDDQDFSFPCFDPRLKETLVTAEEIFNNGQIKPMFPFLHEFHTIPAERFFLEQQVNVVSLDSKSQSVPETIICELSKKMTNLEVEAVEDSKKRCNRRRSSIPFLKLWRFRQDLKRQNYNDGKDGLGFTTPINKKSKGRKEKTRVSSAHEQFYVRNRLKKESNKRSLNFPLLIWRS
ncbi:hypothetical protein PIB30_055625 [Stylosanthes scabra]|uniref:Uncharacterized protein n=1 Tax=Stylosanthes scabra TaxID=79078 RepID=A0ABU6QIK4_9FABA|nr:hypothetical protein [Stylosanthes scabra]